MNRVDSNAAFVTAATTTVQHHVCSTSPIGKPAPTLEAVCPAPILITEKEKEVIFSTAVAVPVRPSNMHRWTEATGVGRD